VPDDHWLMPWYGPPWNDPNGLIIIEHQLACEIPPGHVLSGQIVRLLAREDASDNVLFGLPDGRVAEVHLVWGRSRQTDPHWPSTAVFGSLQEWMATIIMPGHLEWKKRT